MNNFKGREREKKKQHYDKTYVAHNIWVYFTLSLLQRRDVGPKVAETLGRYKVRYSTYILCNV